ncbi:hypothetical protein VE04_02050 [Pseudogymnoascus sp. 24MN13]|nr:hypothetical protein VE04_02050 [Pseudogymnoascus sp. 24MN13]
MARQRSKKSSGDQKSVEKQAQSEFSQQNGEQSDNESVEMMDAGEDEDELARLVLGDDTGFMAQLGQETMGDLDLEADNEDNESQLDVEGEEGENLEDVDDAELFFMDAGPSEVNDRDLIAGAGSDDEQSDGDEPAWQDSDDERLTISLAGNPRLRKLRVSEAEDMVTGPDRPPNAAAGPRASSSSSLSDDDMDMDESLSAQPLAQLLRSSNSLITASADSKRGKLRPEVINIQRTRDIPMVQPSAISSLQFHPIHPVLLSSGPAATIYLHHIAPDALPTPNPLLTSVHIKSTPLHTTAFLGPTGDKIFFSGRRRYFHSWNLETGDIAKVTSVYGQKDEQRSGIVNILDAHTCQWIAAARIEGRNGVADFAWWRDGEGLTIAGKGGEVGEWSVESKSFIALWQDEGAVGTSVLTLGGRSGQKELGGDRWVVIGSSSGIVNIYDRRAWTDKGEVKIPNRPEPTRVFKQLTTPTSCLEISPDGQLLVISSKWKRDALRLIHLPSCTVYRNWPTGQTPLGRVSAVAFNQSSSLLAIANEQGKIKLWEIRV